MQLGDDRMVRMGIGRGGDGGASVRMGRRESEGLAGSWLALRHSTASGDGGTGYRVQGDWLCATVRRAATVVQGTGYMVQGGWLCATVWRAATVVQGTGYRVAGSAPQYGKRRRRAVAASYGGEAAALAARAVARGGRSGGHRVHEGTGYMRVQGTGGVSSPSGGPVVGGAEGTGYMRVQGTGEGPAARAVGLGRWWAEGRRRTGATRRVLGRWLCAGGAGSGAGPGAGSGVGSGAGFELPN